MAANTVDFSQNMARLDKLIVWADNGMVRWQDGNTGESRSLLVTEAAIRLRALNEMFRNILHARRRDVRATDAERVIGNLPALQDFIEKGLQVCQRALAQGSPEDPEARREAKRRRPVTMQAYI